MFGKATQPGDQGGVRATLQATLQAYTTNAALVAVGTCTLYMYQEAVYGADVTTYRVTGVLCDLGDWQDPRKGLSGTVRKFQN